MVLTSAPFREGTRGFDWEDAGSEFLFQVEQLTPEKAKIKERNNCLVINAILSENLLYGGRGFIGSEWGQLPNSVFLRFLQRLDS